MVIKIANEKKKSVSETERGHGHKKAASQKWEVTKSQSENIAMKAVPGGEVMEAEREHESGMYRDAALAMTSGRFNFDISVRLPAHNLLRVSSLSMPILPRLGFGGRARLCLGIYSLTHLSRGAAGTSCFFPR